MSNKKPWTIFDPLPDQSFPDLGTTPSKDLLSGKTSKDIHKEVFGDLSDRGLYDDIFGNSKKRSKQYTDETLESKRARRPIKNRRDF